MLSYALIVDGRVRSIETFPEPPQMHPALTWVECAGNAAAVVGATCAGGVFTGPVVDQAAELAARQAALRSARDQRLAACDWSQMPDAAIPDAAKADWRAYRQKLRDVPNQAGFPGAVDWPVAP